MQEVHLPLLAVETATGTAFGKALVHKEVDALAPAIYYNLRESLVNGALDSQPSQNVFVSSRRLEDMSNEELERMAEDGRSAYGQAIVEVGLRAATATVEEKPVIKGKK